MAEARTAKLTLNRLKTIIGHGTPNEADSHDARALFFCAYPEHLGCGKAIAFWATTASPSTAAPSSPSLRSGCLLGIDDGKIDTVSSGDKCHR